jgi:signal transduction histidine kinase
MKDKPRVLIVNNNSEELSALALLIQKQRLEVHQATNSREALDLASEYDFCASIINVQMPEMDGYELVEGLRADMRTANLPVILISDTDSDVYEHRKAFGPGAVDFLNKPFNPQILLSKIQVFTDLYNQRQELQSLYSQMVAFNEQLEGLVRERTQELQKAYDVLERLDQTKNDFIHIAAHELRTPLTLISGYAEMLEGLVSDKPEAKSMVEGILLGQSRLIEVVNSLMDISRIDNQAVDVNIEAVNFRVMIDTVCNSYESTFRERELTLKIFDLNDLPEIEADVNMIHKVFKHLIVNAIKYTPNGGTIQIRGRELPMDGNGNKSSSAVQIMVTDTGIGINPEHHELIFEKFFQTGPVQLHSSGRTKFKGGGSGLGLSIARGIVEMHGGRIWVESSRHDEEELPGSTFHVLLPVNLNGNSWISPEHPVAEKILRKPEKVASKAYV